MDLGTVTVTGAVGVEGCERMSERKMAEVPVDLYVL